MISRRKTLIGRDLDLDLLRPDFRLPINRVLGAETVSHDIWERQRCDQGSIACWVNPSSAPGDGLWHFYGGINLINFTPGTFVSLVHFDVNFIGAIFNNGVIIDGAGIPDAVFTAHQWHLLVARFSGAGCDFYFNGAFGAAGPSPDGDRFPPAGSQYFVGSALFDAEAQLRTFMYWNRLLTPEEIAMMYRNRVGF